MEGQRPRCPSSASGLDTEDRVPPMADNEKFQPLETSNGWNRSVAWGKAS